jgi:hypothetical protein
MMPVKLSEVGRTITLRFSPQDIWVGVRWERWSQGCEFRFSAESGRVIPHGYEHHFKLKVCLLPMCAVQLHLWWADN